MAVGDVRSRPMLRFPQASVVHKLSNLAEFLEMVGRTSKLSVHLVLALTLLVAATVPAGARNAYVPNGGSDTVSVISLATNLVTATIPVGAGPTSAVATPDGSKVYVANQAGGTVSVIGTAENTVATTIDVGPSPSGAALTLDGSMLYVPNPGADTVSVIDTASSTVEATVGVGSEPASFGAFVQHPPPPPSPILVASLLPLSSPASVPSISSTRPGRFPTSSCWAPPPRTTAC
jgi:YVTN family beta-propeller protein